MLLTIPVIYFLFRRDFGSALIVFALAGISDGLDGYLAKKYGWESRLGGLLDPLADKALLIASFLVLGGIGLIPVWLVLAVIFRDFLIVGGALYYHFRVETLEADPSWASKLNTLVQILVVISIVCNAGPLPLPQPLIQTLIWATLVTTVVSGAGYVWVWTNKARERGIHD